MHSTEDCKIKKLEVLPDRRNRNLVLTTEKGHRYELDFDKRRLKYDSEHFDKDERSFKAYLELIRVAIPKDLFEFVYSATANWAGHGVHSKAEYIPRGWTLETNAA